MDVEQRALNITRGHTVLSCKEANNREEPVPFPETEAGTIRVGCDGTHRVEQLPDPDIDDAIADRIRQHQNG